MRCLKPILMASFLILPSVAFAERVINCPSAKTFGSIVIKKLLNNNYCKISIKPNKNFEEMPTWDSVNSHHCHYLLPSTVIEKPSHEAKKTEDENNISDDITENISHAIKETRCVNVIERDYPTCSYTLKNPFKNESTKTFKVQLLLTGCEPAKNKTCAFSCPDKLLPSGVQVIPLVSPENKK